MQIGDSEGLEFLDLKLTIDSSNKIETNFYGKPINSFMYVLPSISYNKKNINSA